ncbi:hypothetical protein PS2_033857 [Malus domestica]
MFDELPSDDQLPAADMSNKLPDDGLSSDDSSNNLVQDGGIHELSSVSIPTKLQDALFDPKWVNAMKVEIEALEKNSTWDLFDVKNAFLHGDLQEEVYMDLPPGIGTSPGKGVVCRLRKGLYVIGDDQKEIQCFQKYLATDFEMKELGELKYFLGIEVARSKHDQVPTHKEWYQRLVGRLIYLSHTRPDIAYAVSVNGHLNVEGYTNADWAVTWRSKKQKVVARSSAEAEFRGMSHGVCELLWLKKLLRDLGFKPKCAMKLHCDNKAAIEIAHNPVQHDRTKHVKIDRHFIKKKLDAGIIMFPFVRSEDQLADALTKTVSNSVVSNSLDKLGMRDIFAST